MKAIEDYAPEVQEAFRMLLAAGITPDEYRDALTASQVCVSALVPVAGPVEPCIEQGRHRTHVTVEGRRWIDPLDEEG